jgi:hypothetical protein
MTCVKKQRDFEHAISLVNLTPLQLSIIQGRFMPLVVYLTHRTQHTSIMFHVSRSMITVGSLIVPALLSIHGFGSSNTSIYWATWVISLLVTVCNALVSLFKLDKRYYYINTILEKLISEGWQYVELTGKYSGYFTPNVTATHENQFVYFCHAVEKIRMKHVEHEYYTMSESQGTQSAQENAKTSLILPTPQPGELENLPKDLIYAVKQVSQPSVENGSESQKADKKSATNGSPTSVSVSFDM